MTRLVAAIALLIAALSPAAAKTLVAEVDLSDQRMTVFYKGEALVNWVVSTGRPGYRTPTGVFRPQRMYVDYYSIQYDGSPMPHSVFYDRGYAIHGSYEIGSLGRPASHGCIRLHPGNAQKFFDLILTVGAENTQIRVVR
jgi:lipoprotein-anchoring transpeptidase ErfK/SrfK